MRLQDIRQTETFEALKPAIKYLCDHMEAMAWGEFNAYKSTLEQQAIKIGATVKDLNEYAEQYQVFGYETEINTK